MLRLVGSILAMLVACASAHAESRLLRETLPSKALGRQFPYVVYLPSGYETGTLNYPVMYLLHGAGGNEESWAKDGKIKATADRLIASQAIPPAVIVMPGCRGCWWVDGTVDQADTAFWQDLVPAIAQRYRVIEGRRGMVVGGLSAGGFGAVRFGMEHPDKVAAVAALSPAVYAVAPPAKSSARFQPPFRRGDGTFDIQSWQSKNYTASIDGYFRQHNRVAFYLMSGDADEYGIVFETVGLFKRLYERQPKHTQLRVIDGTHSWDVWSRSIANAMRYAFRFVDRPQAVNVTASGPSGPTGLALRLSHGDPLRSAQGELLFHSLPGSSGRRGEQPW